MDGRGIHTADPEAGDTVNEEIALSCAAAIVEAIQENTSAITALTEALTNRKAEQ